jgi:hypothetical protein
VDDLLREALGIGRQRVFEDQPHHLPVPGECGLGRGELDHDPVRGARRGFGRYAFYLGYVAEAEVLEVGHLEAPHRPRRVTQSVGPIVPVLGGVRGVARAYAVEDRDHGSASHTPPLLN